MTTRRDNFLRTLRHEKHDRLPAYFVIDNFNYPQPLPAGFDLPKITSFTAPEEYVELSRYLGLDTVIRITPSVVNSKILSRETPLDNGRTTESWETPSGELRSLTVQSAEANTVFTVEHPVKELEDYRKLISLFEQDELSINLENVKECKRYLEVLGEEGIAYSCGPGTPIMDLTRGWVGLENFVFHLKDAPDLVESVLNLMAENYYRQYEIIAAHTPCEVIVFWDDVNSLYLSPKLFEKYVAPVLSRFAEIAHRHNKILVDHTCGRINAFVDAFLKTGVDAIDWVTPAPSGDIDPRRVWAVWGDKITMMLAVVPGVMRNGSPDEVEEHLHSLLRGLDLKQNFVLMIPPPVGTPLENVQRILQVLANNYGILLNRSEKFGSVLEPKLS